MNGADAYFSFFDKFFVRIRRITCNDRIVLFTVSQIGYRMRSMGMTGSVGMNSSGSGNRRMRLSNLQDSLQAHVPLIRF